jgi:hypothetical protein
VCSFFFFSFFLFFSALYVRRERMDEHNHVVFGPFGRERRQKGLDCGGADGTIGTVDATGDYKRPARDSSALGLCRVLLLL